MDDMALKGRKLRIQLSSVKGRIHTDEHLLGRALDNVIDNAIKYSDRGSWITIRADRIEEQLVIYIIDEGSGITEESLPYLFDTFYRVDPSRNSRIPGSGLGLSIVKEIMALLGGEIDVIRNAEKGTTFRLKLYIAD
jgi:signal transduction histidine kinase